MKKIYLLWILPIIIALIKGIKGWKNFIAIRKENKRLQKELEEMREKLAEKRYNDFVKKLEEDEEKAKNDPFSLESQVRRLKLKTDRLTSY